MSIVTRSGHLCDVAGGSEHVLHGEVPACQKTKATSLQRTQIDSELTFGTLRRDHVNWADARPQLRHKLRTRCRNAPLLVSSLSLHDILTDLCWRGTFGSSRGDHHPHRAPVLYRPETGRRRSDRGDVTHGMNRGEGRHTIAFLMTRMRDHGVAPSTGLGTIGPSVVWDARSDLLLVVTGSRMRYASSFRRSLTRNHTSA